MLLMLKQQSRGRNESVAIIKSTSYARMYTVSMVALLAILMLFTLKATATPQPCKGK